MTDEIALRIAAALERQVVQCDELAVRHESARRADLARMADNRASDLTRIKEEHAELVEQVARVIEQNTQLLAEVAHFRSLWPVAR